MQLTRESCEECVPLEDFYKSNHHAFVLFYERALAGKHHYKQAIVTGFHAACADLRYSHIVCGVVDMVNDKDDAGILGGSLPNSQLQGRLQGNSESLRLN